jgi:ATP:ADP antiporter, AAA family
MAGNFCTQHPHAAPGTRHPHAAPGTGHPHAAPGTRTQHPAPGTRTQHPAPARSTRHAAPARSTRHPAPGTCTATWRPGHFQVDFVTLTRLKRFFDIRPGEAAPLLLAFLYIAFVVASLLLAKPIRNGLFLDRFGAENLVYVYVAVPLVLSIWVPLYARVAARHGQRAVATGSLVFFFVNLIAFWVLFRFYELPGLPAVFFIWVNCFAVIAPVQAWNLAHALFDTRQARRLFGLIGSGASLGAIAGGLMASTLVRPLGGTINLMLIVAALVAIAAVIVNVAWARLATLEPVSAPRSRVPFGDTLRRIQASRYLKLIVLMVVLVVIVTQWTQFQLSLAAQMRFTRDADRLTEFFGAFNFYLGIIAFLVQVFFTGPALRRFGIGFAIIVLPLSLGAGSFLILLAPVLWTVLLTNALDQTLRFSIDKAGFELLYLPIAPAVRAHVKAAIDVIVNRGADAVGGLLLGMATQGFDLLLFRLPSAGLGLRGLAALNLGLIAVWVAVALALRREYVATIAESIQQHRLDAEAEAATALDRSTADLVLAKLSSKNSDEILYALALLEMQQEQVTYPEVRRLLDHPLAAVRRRSLAFLTAAGDGYVRSRVEALLQDPDLETRTEALLYLVYHAGIDPLERLRELGDFRDFSIRAGMVAFLARSGPRQNVDAARLLLDAMVGESGPAGQRTRLEAARLMSVLDDFQDQFARLVRDPDPEVARAAVKAVGQQRRLNLASDVLSRLGDSAVGMDAADALGLLGDAVLDQLRASLYDANAPMEIRRAIPGVLVRIGTNAAQALLMESLLQSDNALRFRILSSLNKLRQQRPDMPLDAQIVESVLAAEIMGHYRSYQILGSLGDALDAQHPAALALRQSIDMEVERIFRLLGLLFPRLDLHSAYFGLQSANPAVRANALEFLDNVLRPQLRALLVPLLDFQITLRERVALANEVLGSPVENAEEAVAALLASQDPWLQASAAYTIGVLGLSGHAARLEAWATSPDHLLRDTAREALQRLREQPVEPERVPEPEVPPWETSGIGIG